MTRRPAGAVRRVIIASRVYAPEPAAAAFRLAALSEAFADGGAEVSVLTVRLPGGSPPVVSRRVRVHRFPVLRDRSGYVRGYLQYLSFDVPLAFRLAWQVLRHRPDVVVAEPPPTTGAVVRLVCSLARVPYAYYAADLWSRAAASTAAPRFVVRLLEAVEAWTVRGAAVVLSVSETFTATLRGLTDRVATVGNGVDTATFTPEGPARSFPGPAVVYAGTASEWQGAEVFVRAFEEVARQMPQARLIFVGQGTSWPLLQAFAVGSNGAVAVEPQVPADQAAEILRGARAALVSLRPGQGYDFAFPTKVYAAAACGTPVIFAGPGPAAAAVRDEGLGVAVAYDDETSLAAAMVDALRAPLDEDSRRRRAEWAVGHVSLRAQGLRAAEQVLDAARKRRQRGSANVLTSTAP